MPLVKSYYKLSEKYSSEFEGKDHLNTDISALVSDIANEILTKDPGLVVEASEGGAARGGLEDAIIQCTEARIKSFGFYQDELLKRVRDFMFGYGPLQDYIEDEDITDIDGSRYNEFSIKKNGIRSRIDLTFKDYKTFDTFCRLIIIRNGGIINENDSHCRVVDEDKRLRINVSIPPRNITGTSISIRKHRRNCYSLDDLQALGMMTASEKEFLRLLADTDASLVFCGKGASGKTTLLRAFVDALPEMERVLVLESDSEIYPEKSFCIAQRIKKSNEGGRQVTLKELVADGLTMSLDTYCVGEIVGDEAWEFLKAAFSGHRCLATTHSESAMACMDRLLTLARPGASGESEDLIKDIIGRGLDYIVYLKEFRLGEILKLKGYDSRKNEYLTELVNK